MMAAGQNPLQLAMQQGTQITQIIGPMGAGGAVKALGSAFMQMINPVSLITLGSIAAGAAMVGWLTDAGEEALTFEEQLESLNDGIDNYGAAVKDAGLDTAAMIERFGSGAVEARKYLTALTEIKRREALINAEQVQKQFTTDTGGFFQDQNRFYIGNKFGLEGPEGMSKGSHALVAKLISAYEQLDSTANQSLDKQVSAWQGLFDVMELASLAADGISESENKQLGQIAEQILRLQELRALDEAGARVKDAAIAKQQEMLAGLKQEAAINQAIATYGASSAQVANLRLQYKRAAYQQDVAELGVAKDLQDTLMKTFDQVNRKRLVSPA